MASMDYSSEEAFAQEMSKLRHAVEVAQEQATMAAMLHETWYPTAYDVELHARMGTSYATQSFRIVRWALRRELILALMRIWDNNREALSLTRIREYLRKQKVFKALVLDRARRTGFDWSDITDMMTAALDKERQSVLPMISKYMEGGSGHETFKKLRNLRNERLAHRQLDTSEIIGVDPTDEEVEVFYLDTLELVSCLLGLVNGIAIDMSDAVDVYKFYARFFWANVRGERTGGSPSNSQ